MDWDDAYANIAHIPGGEAIPGEWMERSGAFRSGFSRDRMQLGIEYGPHPREVTDVFLPEGRPKGVVVFVHGGYWMKFDQTVFSHLAKGALAHGWTMVMPGYPLAPEVRIADITQSIARAIQLVAGQHDGPIRLAGHSAGGHLVTRQICQDSGLAPALIDRIAGVLSISGVHDLRPLLKTAMNADLRLGMEEATAESPALLVPMEGRYVHAWVGGNERPEFLRQTALLANVWSGFDVDIDLSVEPGRHHLDVIAGLADAASEITGALLED